MPTPAEANRLRSFVQDNPWFIPALRTKLEKPKGLTLESYAIESAKKEGGESIIEAIEIDLQEGRREVASVSSGEFTDMSLN